MDHLSTSSAIVSQLQELNTGLVKLYDPIKKIADGGIDLNTLLTTIAGLVGVLVGAFISYYFSKKISDQSTRARIAIQRKNLIFSKLFKELVIIRNILEELPEGGFHFEIETLSFKNDWSRYGDNFYFAGKMYTKPSYQRWYEMKNDIRKTQVPKELAERLDSLEQAFSKYYLAHKKLDTEARTVEVAENGTMIQLYQQSGHPNTRFNISTHKIFFRDISIEEIVDDNKKQYGLSEEGIIVELRKIIEKVLHLESRQKTIVAFDEVKKELGETLEALEVIIQKIIDKYEYGNSL